MWTELVLGDCRWSGVQVKEEKSDWEESCLYFVERNLIWPDSSGKSREKTTWEFY